MSRKPTIRAQLLLYFSLLVLLWVGLSAFAIERLVSIESAVSALNRTQLGGTRLSADIDDEISDFLLAEVARTVAENDRSAEDSEYSADQAALAIERTGTQFLALNLSENVRGKFLAFRVAWQDVLTLHRQWLARAGITGGIVAFLPRLVSLHRDAALALNSVKGSIGLESVRQGEVTERQVEVALYILIGATFLGLVLAGWIANVVRTRISNPLSSITNALAALASGKGGAALPEANRTDEIGRMARAFEVFRQNAVALEKAHEAAEAAQKKAHALARHDALTGLPNRRVFSEELDKALARANAGEGAYAVLLIDLDNFKPVNDQYGHAVGDIVLGEIANRLRGIAGRGDTVARLGGDEFAIIAEGDGTEGERAEAIVGLADRIISAIREPIAVEYRQIEISSSIGIATCPGECHDAETLLRSADTAMYRAKAEGSGRFRFFEPSMETDLRARAALEADVRRAVAEKRIVPHYQPIVALPEGRLVGFEVLARWKHAARGNVPPNVFVPLIEEMGLSSDFTQTILRRACLDARAWRSDINLALNISPHQLRDASLPVQLLSILSETGFPPRRLEIEITETALVSDFATAKSILDALQTIGVRIALDDFGTGYSSLHHLREFHFDTIKIDRSFIQSMGSTPESAEIVRAILSLTQNLNLATVAEGIEDLDTMRRVAEAGCDFGQGYYFGKAVPAAEAAALAQNGVRAQPRVSGMRVAG